MLLYKGSFTRAYSVHSYRRHPHIDPPSILPNLVGPTDSLSGRPGPSLPDSVRDVSYVAILPFPGHVQQVARLLPRLRWLRLQLLPPGDLLPYLAQCTAADRQHMVGGVVEAYAALLGEVLPAPMARFHRFLDEVELSDLPVEAWLR